MSLYPMRRIMFQYNFIKTACRVFLVFAFLQILFLLSSQVVLAEENKAKSSIDSLIAGATIGQSTGLTLPRFVSLKGKRTNMRVGPSLDHKIEWVYIKKGLPVEIIEEFEVWRKIRDVDGQEGWVHKALLSSRRNVIIAPQAKGDFFSILRKPKETSSVVAKLEGGVFATVEKCERNWCLIRGNQYKGWLQDKNIWGVYPNEIIK